MAQRRGSLYILSAGEPCNDYVTARFACKVGVSVLAGQFETTQDGNDLLVDCEQLDEIRNYVRRGRPEFVWPVQIRRVYDDPQITDVIENSFQTINEFAVLRLPDDDKTDCAELYAVFTVLGVEFVVNLGGPSLDRFKQWQTKNGNKSYLEQCTPEKAQYL